MQELAVRKKEISVTRPTKLTNARKEELGHPRSVKAKINGAPPGDPEEQLVCISVYTSVA